MTVQGRFFRICRWILRFHYRRWTLNGASVRLDGATVFICRHRNAIGPIHSLCCLPVGVLPWVFSPFTETKACREHLRNYTFPVTWHISALLARLLAAVLGPAFAALVRSAGAIPVYRNSLRVRETFLKTIEALENGAAVLIFPDIDYAAEEGSTGALYDGFLLLEQLWARKTGGHIRFVPINVSVENRALTVGRDIQFTGEIPFREEKALVVRRLERTLDGMGKKCGI